MADGRNERIVYLRGLAAVMVCFCHYRLAWPEPARDWAKTIGELGVQVFFVISGYIIPYSLHRAGYGWGDFGRFWAKRLVRLQPTFVVALLLTGILSAAAALAKGIPAGMSLRDLARCAVYVDIPTENPVIWSLIVELKYYLLVALLFPLFFAASSTVRRGAFAAALLAIAVRPVEMDWFRHLPYFLVGFAACHVTTGRAGRAEGAILAAAALAVGLLQSTLWQLGAGALTALAILHLPVGRSVVASFYGAISYPLYLVHFPLGVKALNLALPHVAGTIPRAVTGLAVLAGSTAVAYGLHRLVEVSSAGASQRIRYRGHGGPPGWWVRASRALWRRRNDWRWTRRPAPGESAAAISRS